MTYQKLVRLYLRDPLQQPMLLSGSIMSPLCLGSDRRISASACDCYLSYVRRRNTLLFEYAVQTTVTDGTPRLICAQPLTGSCPDPGHVPDCAVAVKNYQALYPEVRQFAFCPAITTEQSETLANFLKAWHTMQQPQWCSLLQHIFPEFFQWVHDVNPKMNEGSFL